MSVLRRVYEGLLEGFLMKFQVMMRDFESVLKFSEAFWGLQRDLRRSQSGV